MEICEELISYNLAVHKLDLQLEAQAFDTDYLVLDQLGGVHQSLADILISMTTANKKDYENMISRLNKYPVLVGQNQILLKEGLRWKVTAVKMFLQKVPAQFEQLLTEKVEESPFYKPFLEMNSSLSEVDKKEIQGQAREALANKVYPALKKFKEFVVQDYIPNAREGISQIDLPKGKAWYHFLVKMHTTTNKTAEELHQNYEQAIETSPNG